jgi:hypothetical protein
MSKIMSSSSIYSENPSWFSSSFLAAVRSITECNRGCRKSNDSRWQGKIGKLHLHFATACQLSTICICIAFPSEAILHGHTAC